MQTSFIFNDHDSTRMNGVRESQSVVSDMSLREQKGEHQLLNRQRKHIALDNKLDGDKLDDELLLQNITEMIKAGLPIVQFPESQIIIDEELLKEGKTSEPTGTHIDNVSGAISQELRGTLYNRVSKNPSLYHDKVERDKYFAGSEWQSISFHQGCWICNSNKIIDRVNKKNQSGYMAVRGSGTGGFKQENN